jgi:hypothetical protein
MLRTAFLSLFCVSVAFAGEKGNKAQAPAAPAPAVVKGKSQDAGKAQAPAASQVVITKEKKVEKTFVPVERKRLFQRTAKTVKASTCTECVK